MSVGPNVTGQIGAKPGRMNQRDNMQRRVDQHLAAEKKDRNHIAKQKFLAKLQAEKEAEKCS